MKKRILKNPVILTVLLIITSFNLFAQDEPFNCVYDAYLFQYNDIYAVNLASGTSILVSENIVEGKINAAGYNSVDGYLWGFLQSKSKTLVRIGKDFQKNEYEITSLPDGGSSSYIGDISIDGIYYFKKNNVTYKVDLNPNSENYLNYTGSFTLSKSINIHDWAFNVNDNKLYAVEKKTNHLYRIDPETETLTDLGEVPILQGRSYTYGAVYFDLDGGFYISANETGTIYKIKKVQDLTPNNSMNSNLFAYGPASASNDGARCPSAPVPDEDCSNAIDDDGDGLVDCDDPACSGVDACPTITLTTSGNEGGLESNNRLSEKITSRNYLRSKTNYNFKANKAPTFKPSTAAYVGGTVLGIEDFIPYDAIENTTPKISSPSDLLNLTNASKIFSVDYLNSQEETVASVLALQTENEVYEHTKYICDRLLGGQILGINTFLIEEELFIKTTIKNPGGEIEHVLSFAVNDKGDTYGVESHWNLDKYSNDTSFYNFQIWSNSVDDLYNLASTILESFKNVKTISSFNNSTPPSTYVRNGYYKNGKLTLNITNTNNSHSLNIKGGIRATETSETEAVNTDLEIDSYSTKIEFESGSLFDFGFRIESDKGGTPDDVFIADGAWGIDDSSYNTNITEYEITPHTEEATENTFLVERNINLAATTANYVSVYKAFTPRFRAIDLNEYNTLKLNTKGTGELSVIIMKDDVENWEDQHKYSYELSDEMETKEIQLSEFKNDNGDSIDLSNVTMIVFTLNATKIGVEEEKKVTIENIQFKQLEAVIVQESVNSDTVEFFPNPIQKTSTIHFDSETVSTYQLSVYNLAGKRIQLIEGEVNAGANDILYEKPSDSEGIYIYKINVQNGKSYNGKLIFIN